MKVHWGLEGVNGWGLLGRDIGHYAWGAPTGRRNSRCSARVGNFAGWVPSIGVPLRGYIAGGGGGDWGLMYKCWCLVVGGWCCWGSVWGIGLSGVIRHRFAIAREDLDHRRLGGGFL
uniref:Uncharacterized protein n=1 Tax=Knipowitschia caucasica TaxID=637954 RepID=A0AAV2M5U8_KNICA